MFTMKFKTGNAAFGYENERSVFDAAPEIIRILDKVKQDIKHGYDIGLIMDINGNHIGEWKLDL